jgi:hypothetical protein
LGGKVIDGQRTRSAEGEPTMTKRVEITVPEPVYSYLERRAKANITSVSSEARTALVRGALIEWRSDEISMGASMSALASNTQLPIEVIMEALGPVMGEGSPLRGYD